MTEAIVESLATALTSCAPEELADILWLLSARPREPADVPGLRPANREEPVDARERDTSLAAAGPEPEPEPGRSDVVLADSERIPRGQPVPAAAIGFRAPAAVGRPLGTTRAFSLFRRIHGPGPPEVDIDATVDATAETGRLAVITRPSRERGLDVALVTDTSPVMTVFGTMLAEFEALLKQVGAFRAVTRWTLLPGPEMRLRDQAAIEHHPDRIIDPSGRRLVLLVTDAAAQHWYGASTWQLLARWADAMPTAVIHVLPEQYRSRGPLAGPGITTRSSRPGAPPRAADARPAWWNEEPAPSGAVPVPVIGLRPSDLEAWAQSVVTGTALVTAVWAPGQVPGPDARAANANLSAEDRVRAFQATASQGAQSLVRLLAGAPVLSWPLIDVLQTRLLPGTGPSELAEVLVGGLLEGVTAWAESDENYRCRFRPGVSELLRRGITATQEWDTFEVITEYLTESAATGNAIHALIADPRALSSVDANLSPFAALGRSAAARLGLAPTDGASPVAGEPAWSAPAQESLQPPPESAESRPQVPSDDSATRSSNDGQSGALLKQAFDEESLRAYVDAIRAQLNDGQLAGAVAQAAAQIAGTGSPADKLGAALPPIPAAETSTGGQTSRLPYLPRHPALSLVQSAIEEAWRQRGTTGMITRARSMVENVLSPGKSSPSDPDWVAHIARAMLGHLAQGKHPFNSQPAEHAISDTARLIVVGDWGTGLPRAQAVARYMAEEVAQALSQGREALVIHLGNIYYSGIPSEVQRRALTYWPVSLAQARAGVTSWSLNGNHDMYSGGFGYFETLLGDPRFAAQHSAGGLPTSFFRLTSPSWDFVGLDTSWHPDVLWQGVSAVLQDPQADFVASVASTSARKVVLLSHHQLASVYARQDLGAVLHAKLGPVLDAGRITAWWWAHERNCMGFSPLAGVSFPRCLGYGGVPAGQAHAANTPVPAPGAWESRGSQSESGQPTVLSGFAVLDLNDSEIQVRYRTQTGATFYIETVI